MTELMIKMTSWLVAAMALGFVVAWFLSKVMHKGKQAYAEDSLRALLLERNNMIEKLEKSFRNKKIMFEKVSNDLKESEDALAEKTSRLTTLQHRLDNTSSNENHSLALKEKNNLQLIQIQKLEQADRKRVLELEGFEEVLLLADEKIEDNEKNYRQILKRLDEDIERLNIENEKHGVSRKASQKNIIDLEESLKLYEANSSAPEFIISKDQFVKIEEQLKIYQKEIKFLNAENSKFLLKLHNEDRVLEDQTIKELHRNSDDSSMVKVFRETYKKITKS